MVKKITEYLLLECGNDNRWRVFFVYEDVKIMIGWDYSNEEDAKCFYNTMEHILNTTLQLYGVEV